MSPLPQLALSVRQPWAWAIIHAGKDFENRSRGALKHLPVPAPFRIAVHASRGMTRREYQLARDFMTGIGIDCPLPALLPRGGIVGTVELVRHLRASESRWSFGCGIELRNPKSVDFIACGGWLGFFDWRRSGPATIAPPAQWMLEEADTPWERARQETMFEVEP